MKAAAALATETDPRAAGERAAEEALAGLGGVEPSFGMVFASPHHFREADAVLDAVRHRAGPVALTGCVGESVLAGSREVEGEPAVAVWLAGELGEVRTFHMEFIRTESGGVFSGWRFDLEPQGANLLIADPFTFPADLLLRHLNEHAPATSIVGGMASGGLEFGESRLFVDGDVVTSGAVGARLSGVEIRTLVSQGCRPIGSPYTVTGAEGSLITELGGQPPLDRIQRLAAEMDPDDRRLLTAGLHLGRVIEETGKTELGRGDFLVRSVVGVDPESGAIAVGDHVEVGEIVQFHVRDAGSADEDLRALLEGERASLGGHSPAGGLLFTCNGRGQHLFHEPDHDAAAVSAALGGPPLAGFFCAGELGPVGGRNFLHGFTASLALFVDGAGAEETAPAQPSA
jgi:small ligand-binding sensory domain FIST